MSQAHHAAELPQEPNLGAPVQLANGGMQTSTGRSVRCMRLRTFALKYFLPLGLVVALVVGLAVPALGKGLASLKISDWGVVQTLCMVLIFIISGLTLKTDDVRAAFREWKAPLFGVISILFVTPTLALLPAQLHFLQKDFQVGFLVFCCMPTTINSGVALVQAAKGSFAMALLLTLVTNLLGIFVSPFFLSMLLSVSDVDIDPSSLFLKLLLAILLPLIVGKLAREWSSSVLALVKKYKTQLSNSSNLAIIVIVLMSISKSQNKIVSLELVSILALVLVGLGIHAIFLAFNFSVSTYLLRLPLEMRKAVVIMGSQKTLPMAMSIVAFLPAEVGEPGLISIPCILSHLVQIFADAFICAKWAQYAEEETSSLAARAPRDRGTKQVSRAANPGAVAIV